jgi:hypothetical protein
MCSCAHTCSESQAIIVAKKQLERNGGRGEVEARAMKEEHGWSVIVWTLPAKPGGFVVVHVSGAGRIVSVEAGL